MIRIVSSSTSAYTATKMRIFMETPMSSVRSGASASSTDNASGSAKTDAASSNATPCFRMFEEALRESQVKRTDISVIPFTTRGKEPSRKPVFAHRRRSGRAFARTCLELLCACWHRLGAAAPQLRGACLPSHNRELGTHARSEEHTSELQSR